jgi:hypothetical protein
MEHYDAAPRYGGKVAVGTTGVYSQQVHVESLHSGFFVSGDDKVVVEMHEDGKLKVHEVVDFAVVAEFVDRRRQAAHDAERQKLVDAIHWAREREHNAAAAYDAACSDRAHAEDALYDFDTGQ